jgi:hypothetical protein
MTDQEARQILQALVNGVDPFTQNDLAAGTVLQHVDVVRAMLAGCSALAERAARPGRRRRQPGSIGKAWTSEEQDRLIQAFRSGENLERVAARLSRRVRAIESRLEILGVITSEQRTTGSRVRSNQRTRRPVRPRTRRKAAPAMEVSGEDGQSHEPLSNS